MKYATLAAAAITAVISFSCTKKEAAPATPAATAGPATERAAAASPGAAAACTPVYYNLAWDAAGNGLVYKIGGSPSAGPVTVSPIIGSAGTNIIGGLSPITKITGLSYNPLTNTAYAVTGSGGSHPNRLIKFNISDPNVVSTTPLLSTCAIGLNLGDIERDQTTGAFYAINNSGADPNNRIVKVDISSGAVGCLPNFIPATVPMRGLSFGCNGQMYAMYVSGTGGKVLDVSKVTGSIIASYIYPGVITPGGVGAPEMGLHFDCSCIGRFITGSLTGGPLLTDGLPAGLGGPLYASLIGVIKPTVDFARP